ALYLPADLAHSEYHVMTNLEVKNWPDTLFGSNVNTDVYANIVSGIVHLREYLDDLDLDPSWKDVQAIDQFLRTERNARFIWENERRGPGRSFIELFMANRAINDLIKYLKIKEQDENYVARDFKIHNSSSHKYFPGLLAWLIVNKWLLPSDFDG